MSYPIQILVEMLREPCGLDDCGHCELERQAADEIERLQAIVDGLIAGCNDLSLGKPWKRLLEAWEAAEKARTA